MLILTLKMISVGWGKSNAGSGTPENVTNGGVDVTNSAEIVTVTL